MIAVYVSGFGIGLFLLVRKKENKKSALILMIGNVLAICIWISGFLKQDGLLLSEITRNTKSGTKKTVEVDAESGEDRRLLQIEVFPQEYDEGELKDLCKEMWDILEEQIAGENDSLNYVTKDLFFPEKMENYPFIIRWRSSEPEFLSESGKIGEDIPEEGVLLEVCALISKYEQDFEEEHVFFVNVFPPKDKDAYWKRLEKNLAGIEKATRNRENYIFPEIFEGKEVRFYKKKRNTDRIIFLLVITGVAAVYVGQRQEKEKQEKERAASMEQEYPELVSRMAMLIGAGITVSGAFKRIAEDYAVKRKEKIKPLYEEILISCREMESGVSERDAYKNMGTRCKLPCVIRFTVLLIQFTKSGGYGLKTALQEETDKAFKERRERAKRLGEEAGTKLLLPMVLMLVLVMIIVMIPAFSSFGI